MEEMIKGKVPWPIGDSRLRPDEIVLEIQSELKIKERKSGREL